MALLYAVRSYTDQSAANTLTRAADAAAQASAKRADASQVSAWVKKDPYAMVVQNLGHAAIYNVEIETRIHDQSDDPAIYSPGPPWVVGVLPPCSEVTVTISKIGAALLRQISHDAPEPAPEPLSVYFTDVNDLTWNTPFYGALRRAAEPNSPSINDPANPDAVSIAKVKNARNCA
jgi:hypothetical protein